MDKRGEKKTRLSIPKSSGSWPSRLRMGLDPELVGLKAFESTAVRNYWRWLLEDYTPRSRVALVTPCSNVKPYPLSPPSRRVRGILKRLGLWEPAGREPAKGRPKGVEWLYFSDLLVFVPYEKAWEHPACCYDVSPDLVIENGYADLIASLASRAIERLAENGVERIIVRLPKKHKRIFSKAYREAEMRPAIVEVPYNLFYYRRLEEAIIEALGLR